MSKKDITKLNPEGVSTVARKCAQKTQCVYNALTELMAQPEYAQLNKSIIWNTLKLELSGTDAEGYPYSADKLTELTAVNMGWHEYEVRAGIAMLFETDEAAISNVSNLSDCADKIRVEVIKVLEAQEATSRVFRFLVHVQMNCTRLGDEKRRFAVVVDYQFDDIDESMVE